MSGESMSVNWKSTLGGAFGAAGTMMVGIGVVPQLGGTPNKFLTYVALVGFGFNVVGTFLGHLFAADASELKSVQQQMLEVPAAIKSGDTERLFKTVEEQKQRPKL